jgi:D-xylose transport system substrate-binding protein
MRNFLTGTTVVAIAGLALAGCSAAGPTTAPGGGSSASGGASTTTRACVILPDAKSSPRWENGDRPALKKAFESAGFTTDIQNAQNDTEKFATIAEQQLSKGCGVMLLVDLQGAGITVAQKAKSQGIPVIAYDRPIKGADYYVSFDNFRVGELEGQMIVDGLKAEGKDPKTAKVVYLGGDPSDGNAKQFADGAAKVMSAAGIKPAFTAKGTWDTDKASTYFEQAYTALKGEVDAVWVANDANAASVIQILDKNGKKVPVSGQDGAVAALQNILLGKQTATVYKPFQLEADQASELAIALLKGEKPTAPKTAADGTPFFAETPIVVTAKNIQQIVDDGNAKAAEICTGDAKAACTKYGVK